MKKIILLILLVHFSCNQTAKNKSKITIQPKNTIIQKESNSSPTLIREDTPIYIGVLQKMYDANEYYIDISFNDDIPESMYNEFYNNTDKYTSTVLSKTESHERFKIEDSTARKFFNVKNIDTLLVFNNEQQIIDTLYLKNYEYLSENTENKVIATYKSSTIINEDKDYLCMSKSNVSLKKKGVFKEDATYLKKVIAKKGFSPSSIHSSYSMIQHKDTISYTSFGVYGGDDPKEYFYLFKNGKATDSIINEYSIHKMLAVPIHLESENLYVSYEHIPDSDIFWTTLKGIDLENNTLKSYSSDRIIVEK